MMETINSTHAIQPKTLWNVGNRIAILGECMIELSGQPFMPQQQAFGGDTLNTAVYLSRLNSALSPSYVTVLGEDNYSQQMIEAWQVEGINCQHVLRDPKRLPGMYAIEIDDAGERSFHYWRNDAAARYLCEHPDFNKVKSHLSEVNWLYLSVDFFGDFARRK